MRKTFSIIAILCFLCFVSKAQSKNSFDPYSTGLKMLHFYPNPAVASINFEFQKGYNSKNYLIIFNFMGKRVYELNNLSYKTFINLEGFYRGIYIYQLRDKKGAVLESGKFQVSR
jgi:hypothetical protein